MAIIYWILKDKGHNADSLGFALLGAPMAADGARISLSFIALDGFCAFFHALVHDFALRAAARGHGLSIASLAVAEDP